MFMHYGVPDYVAGLIDARIGFKTANWNEQRLDNSFQLSGVMSIAQDFEDEEAAESMVRKVQNKFEANITFGELNVMNKAMNLGYYSMLGDMSLLNGEIELYRSITAEEIADYIRRNLNRNQSATLIYRSKR
jgi:hypothetical protein